MGKEEIEEQIVRCKELQSNCRIDDIETFLRLSKRIESWLHCLMSLKSEKLSFNHIIQ